MSAANTSEVFSKMLKIQLLSTAVLAVVLLFIWGANAGLSALFGGLSVVAGVYCASLVGNRALKAQEASAVLVNLLKAEAVKIAVIIVLLLLAFKFYVQLVPAALIVGLAVSALFSAVALSKLNV